MMTKCEAYSQRKRRWVEVTIKELDATPYKLWPAGLRCCECHGEVGVRVGVQRGVSYFLHRHENNGCSQVRGFDGVRRQHPKPLELAPS
jgi:hypothetical protein